MFIQSKICPNDIVWVIGNQSKQHICLLTEKFNFQWVFCVPPDRDGFLLISSGWIRNGERAGIVLLLSCTSGEDLDPCYSLSCCPMQSSKTWDWHVNCMEFRHDPNSHVAYLSARNFLGCIALEHKRLVDPSWESCSNREHLNILLSILMSLGVAKANKGLTRRLHKTFIKSKISFGLHVSSFFFSLAALDNIRNWQHGIKTEGPSLLTKWACWYYAYTLQQGMALTFTVVDLIETNLPPTCGECSIYWPANYTPILFTNLISTVNTLRC